MRIRLAFLICLLSLTLEASQRAVTDEGEIVILNDDGTWVFESPENVVSSEIPTSTEEFERLTDSSFRLKSTINDSEIWINPKKWSFSRSQTNEATEYEFQLKGKDLYGMLITEQIVMGMEGLTQIVLDMAKPTMPDIRISDREYRIVNGNRVVYMEMQGTMQGTDFTYRDYYFSNESGTTQLITWTGTSLTEKYRSEIQNFLNGLSVQ